MSLPRLRLLLFTACLLLSQLGGLLHGLTHIHQDQDRTHACQLCAAYSVFDHAVAGKALPLPVVERFLPSPPSVQSGIAGSTRPPYLSRAPPLPV